MTQKISLDLLERKEEDQPLKPRNRRMLTLLREWEQTPLTEDEIAVLDDLEMHIIRQPVAFHTPPADE